MNRCCVLAALLLAVQSTGTTHVIAGPLANHPQAFNDGNGPAGGAWTGIGTYLHEGASLHLQGTIEWTVFAPGQFPYAGLNGWTPVPGQLTYAYQILNTGSEGIADFQFQGALNGVGNAGAVALGGANEAPFYAADVTSGNAFYGFAHYDSETDEYIGDPLPGSTGVSVGLVVSSSRVPTSGPGLVRSYEGSLYPNVRPVVAIPNGSMYVPPSVPGDYSNDGKVDAADYVVWRDNLGQTFQLSNEVAETTPGEVTPEDYDAWKSHFGESTDSGSGNSSSDRATVPEPTTLPLLMLAAPCWIRRRG